MRRTAVLLIVMGIVTLLVAGTVFAAVRCSGGECSGTDMAERIFGSASGDYISAKSGNDEVFGRGGDDIIKGQVGNDELYGHGGRDRPKGGPGEDTVFGGPGDDTLRGGTHDLTDDGVRDILDCGEREYTVYYTPGVDEIKDCETLNPSP